MNRKTISEEYNKFTLILRAANATHYLELQPNEDLVDFPIHSEDFFQKDVRDSPCHFHGKIISQPTGFAAISACSGDGKMTGILMMQNRMYVLRPYTNSSQNNTDNKHFLYEYGEENTEFYGINNEKRLNSEPEKVSRNPIFLDINHNRVKRGILPSNRKVIEVAVFVDNDLYKRIKATTAMDPRRATSIRVMEIMNQVQLIYGYSSLQTKFKIVVVKLQILESSKTAPNAANGDMNKYLENFCSWQNKLNPKEGVKGHWDHAIMLTGKDLYKVTEAKKDSKVLGLSWLNGMCRPNRSCSVNEGTSFEAAFVIAHEIAHNLGAMHDGSGNNCDGTKYIMSYKTGAGQVHWSACSNEYIRNFLGNGYGKCLSNDVSPPNRILRSTSLPGEKYSLADQCFLALGAGFKPYKSNNNVCQELLCASGQWTQYAHPALDGSPCDDGKICLEGRCQNKLMKYFSLLKKNNIRTHFPKKTL